MFPISVCLYMGGVYEKTSLLVTICMTRSEGVLIRPLCWVGPFELIDGFIGGAFWDCFSLRERIFSRHNHT